MFETSSPKITAADLFTAPDGFSEGAIQAGVETLVAVEYDLDAWRVRKYGISLALGPARLLSFHALKHNHPTSEALFQDVTQHTKDYDRLARGSEEQHARPAAFQKKLDILLASPRLRASPIRRRIGTIKRSTHAATCIQYFSVTTSPTLTFE